MSALTKKGLTRAQLRGFAIVPMLTPFTVEGQLDEDGVARIVEHVIAGGCQGLMVCGTTGEFASMSIAMRLRTVEVAINAAAGRAAIFAGIGDTSPAHSITLAHGFLTAGADAVVANLPSYYPLSPARMEAYFIGLADAIYGPVYLYNIPQTTRQSIPLDVVARLSNHFRIAGIKDSEPDGARQEQLCALFAGRKDFAVFCGSVAFASRAMRAGADGFVPGAGNFEPALMRRLMDELVAGDPAADDTQRRIDALNAVYQKDRIVSQVFGSLKAIMEIRGLCSREMLPPLVRAGDAEVAQIRAKLEALEAA
jgi:4-hydroxy-tetrahydrodipicolinate synthase